MTPNPRFYWPLLFLPLVALLVIVPYWFQGTSCGHDLSFHVQSWLETTDQWELGTIYPRWAMQADYGNGEPRFIFYPPLSWILGSLLGLVLPWPAVPPVFIFLCCTGAGISLYRLAREWLEKPTAFLAAALYTANAYQLMVVYERSAFAELLAAAFVPLVILCILRQGGIFWRDVLLLTLALAAVWLTNAPAAVMSTYLTFFLALLRSVHLRKPEPWLRASAALALALGLAAFYLVPAAYEQKWVIIGQALSPGLRPQDNFLFTRIGDHDHDAVLRRISYFCLLEFGAMAIVIWLARPLRKQFRFLYGTFTTIAILCIFVTLPASSFLWHLPKLAYMQFPFRWLLVFNIVFAVLAAVSLARTRFAPVLLCLLVPAIVGGSYMAFRQNCDPEDTVNGIVQEYNSDQGYLGTDEYCPVTGDNYNIDADSQIPRLTTEMEVTGDNATDALRTPAPEISAVKRWEPEYRSFTVDSPLPTSNTLRLMNYPAWKAEMDGKPLTTGVQEGTGRMVVELPAGHHQVTLRFTRTTDRFWGGVISLVSLGITIALWLFLRSS